MKQKTPSVPLPLILSFVFIISLTIILNHTVKAAPTATIIVDVDTTSDTNMAAFQACTAVPDDCSMRGAVSKANADPGNDYIINIPADTFTFALGGSREDNNATGDLDLANNITLMGAGVGTTIIDANQLDRVIDVVNGINVTIENVTLTNGKTPDGAVDSNGDNGGGIRNSGTLTMTLMSLTNSRTGAGGLGRDGQYLPLCIPGGSDGDPGGRGGEGGGIFNNGILHINESSLSGNTTGAGGAGGIPGMCLPDVSGTGGPGGIGGNGAAIYNSASGTAVISNSLINDNQTGNGGNFRDNYLGTVPFVGGGNGGSGGAIYNLGSLTIANSTFSANITGSGGNGYYPGFTDGAIAGIAGYGGGIYNQGTVTITHATLTLNQIGNAGIGDPPSTASSGGGLYQSSGSLQVMNSIIANNDMPTADSNDDCHGAVTSQGYNLVGVGTGCPTNGSSDQTTTNPQLGALADNGGASFTHALLAGSSAIDQIPEGSSNCAAGTSSDQRNAVRADGSGRGGEHCDIGAYEYDSSETPTAMTLVNVSADANTGIPLLLCSLIGLTALIGLKRRFRRKARK